MIKQNFEDMVCFLFLKILIFFEYFIGFNLFNDNCMNIQTRGNDSPDSVAIHIYPYLFKLSEYLMTNILLNI